MKNLFLIFICLCSMIWASSIDSLAQNITYIIPNDSISFSVKGDSVYQNHWRNGILISTKPVIDTDSVSVSFNEITYLEDEDGAAIMSNLGDYAYMDISSDYQYYILTIGSSSDSNLKRHVFFDIEKRLPVYYLDSSGNIFDIIKIDDYFFYIVNENTGGTYILECNNIPAHKTKSHSLIVSMQNFLFDCIATAQNIGNTINDTFDEIIENLSDGRFNSTDVGNVKDIFDFLKNISNVGNAYNALQSLGNIQFFNNVHISTGGADVSSLNTQLHASISNLPPNGCTFSPSYRYEKIFDYNYILHLNVSDFNSQKSYQKNIVSNGDYVFSHSCSQYNHGYFYEASLELNVTLEIDMDVLYEVCKQDWPPSTPIPTGKKYVTRSWTIPGGTRNFKTESPNICGNWNAVWHTTPPNAKLLTMSISENGSCTQTYYYANRGENVTYTCNYVYNYPTLTLNKDNGDVQHWEITDYTPNSMTLQASDGFCYYLSK